MSMCNHISSIGVRLLSLQLVVFLGSCSVFLKYDECDKNEDCSGDNIVCEDGYCVTKIEDWPLDNELLSEANNCTRLYGVGENEAGKDSTILLGAVLPESGDLSVFGPKMSEGIELAVKEINQAGGILGKDIAVLFCDSGTDSETAVNAIKHIAGLKKTIPAVIGPAADSVVLEAYDKAAKDAGLVLVTPSAKSPILDSAIKTNYVWRMNPSDTTQGTAIASYLLDKGYEKIAVINRNDEYGNGLREAINTTLCETFACDENTYYSGVYDKETASTQYSQMVVDLQEFIPDITILISYFEDGAGFLKVANDAEQTVSRFFVTDGLRSDKLLDADLSDETLCTLAGTHIGTPSGKNYESFLIRYKSEYGAAGTYSAHAYDAVYMLSYAIAATNTVNPTGSDVAKGMTRLSAGDDVNAGSSDWRIASQKLSENADATINYQGASGPLDFGVSESDEENTTVPAVEAWSIDLNEKTIISLGYLYSAEGVYTDVLGAGDPGTGEVCSKGQVPGEECDNIADCDEGHYCDLTLDPPRCMSPPSGQGEPCKSHDDCAEFDANFCEDQVSKTCLVPECDLVLDNCSPGYHCCSFEVFSFPNLCVDEAESGGVCKTGMTCTDNEACEEDEYCDLSVVLNPDDAAAVPGSCLMTPSGLGQPCDEPDDCAGFRADYCENLIAPMTHGTGICLVQGCDIHIENCPPGYYCCDFHGLTSMGLDVALCVDEEDSQGICACSDSKYCRDGEYCGPTTIGTDTIDACIPIEEN